MGAFRAATNHTNRTLKAQTYASFGPCNQSCLLDTSLKCDVEPEDYNGAVLMLMGLRSSATEQLMAIRPLSGEGGRSRLNWLGGGDICRVLIQVAWSLKLRAAVNWGMQGVLHILIIT